MNTDYFDIFADEKPTPSIVDAPNVKEEFFDVFADEKDSSGMPIDIQQEPKPSGTYTQMFDANKLLAQSQGVQAPPVEGFQPDRSYVGGVIGGPTELNQMPEQPGLQRPPGIYQGNEQDFASLSGASQKAIQSYLTEASLGAPKLMPGYKEETPYGWEKLPVGIAGAGGFITGAPVGIVKGVTKGKDFKV